MERLENAIDRSTYIVKVDFTDENAAPVTPLSATWSLTDGNGEIVNERDGVTLSGLDSTVYIALSDDDVAAGSVRSANERILVVEGVYISSTTGTQMPVKEGVKFLIEDLPNV